MLPTCWPNCSSCGAILVTKPVEMMPVGAIGEKAAPFEARDDHGGAFERDENRARREAIDQQFKQKSEAAFGALQERAQGKHITLLRTPMGLALAPTRDGKVLATGTPQAAVMIEASVETL